MRWIFFTFAMVFSLVTYSQEQWDKNTGNNKKTSSYKKSCTSDQPILVKIIPAQEAERKTADEEEYKKEKSTEERILAYATVFLAIVTGFLALFTGGLWLATYRLGKDSKAASERQADELRKIERAFVYLEGFKQEIISMGEMPDISIIKFCIRPLWRNSGNTPTSYMNVFVNWSFHKGLLPYGFSYKYENSSGQQFFLAPKAIDGSDFLEIPSNYVMESINSSINQSSEERQHLYIWGMVKYQDIFGQYHFTQFCYRIHFSISDGKTISANFIQWGKHNRTDN